jgi:hypothetical protein
LHIVMALQGTDSLEKEPENITKLAYTAVAAPGPSSDSTDPHDIHDLTDYIPTGKPATKKEVWSYYTYYAGNNGIGSAQ